MHQFFPRAMILSSFLLGVTSFSTLAATRLPLRTINLSQLQQWMFLNLPGGKQPLIAGVNSLKLVSQHQDAQHVNHVRLQQMYAGFPVQGGFAILHSVQNLQAFVKAPSGKLTGVIYQDLRAELGQPAVDFLPNASVALRHFKAQYPAIEVSEDRVEPLVFMDRQHKAHWAYRVSLLHQPLAEMPARPTAILQADNFKPLKRWNEVKTERALANGTGYGGNSRIGKYQFGKNNLPYLILTRNEFYQRCYMENSVARVIDMGGHYAGPISTIAFDCLDEDSPSKDVYWTGYQGDGYDHFHHAYSPANDALYAANSVQNLYKDWYDVYALTFYGQPRKLIMRVHYGTNYENAFWDGKQMSFGDGGYMLYPLVSLDITAHEVSHGFTEAYSNLQYEGESGAMNEAFSDMAAQAAMYYVKGYSNWMIGADIMRESSGLKALRYMDHPSEDGNSIERADEFTEDMDVHYSSGVYNRLFYLLATRVEWGVRRAFHVMLKANMDYWTPTSTFAEGACGIIDAARDLNLSTTDIKEALNEVAIDYSEC